MAGRIITVAQQKGGSGKTTVAVHLAVAWSGGLRVALLDVDPQGSSGEWFERREQRLGESDTGLTFRTASGWGARREARALARDFDLVVVDTPAHADRDARTAMEAAALVVIPMQPTPADLWASEATLDLATKARVPTAIVLNRVPARTVLTEEIVAALADAEATLSESRLGNRVEFARSLGRGATSMETASRGRAALEAQALAAELLAGFD